MIPLLPCHIDRSLVINDNIMDFIEQQAIRVLYLPIEGDAWIILFTYKDDLFSYLFLSGARFLSRTSGSAEYSQAD